MRKKSNKTPRESSGAFRKMAIVIFAPAAILLVLVLILTGINYYSISNSTKKSSHQVVKSFFQYNEALIQNFASALLILDDNSELMQALISTDYSYDPENFKKSCDEIRTSFPFAQEIYVLNKTRDSVYTDYGRFGINTYFQNECVYDDFNTAYFRDFRFYTTERYRILLPTGVVKNGERTQVLPVIVRRIGDFPQKNLLIVNINLQKLFVAALGQFEMYDMPVYIYNKYKNDIYEITQSGQSFDFSSDFTDSLLHNDNDTFSFRFGRKNYLISAYSSSNSILGYIFFSVMPESIILHKTLPIILLLAGIILFFTAVMFLLLLRSTSSIVTPLENILAGLSLNGSHLSQNIIDDIGKVTMKMYAESKDLSLVYPSAQKQFLLGLMTSTEYALDDSAAKTILNSLDFPYGIFAIVTIRLIPSLGFFDVFNSNDYKIIRKGFFNLVESLFKEHFRCSVIPEKNNQLYIVLNFQIPSDYRFADRVLADLYCDMRQDKDYVTLSMGKSECCDSLSDLHRAYNEAFENMTEYDLSGNQIVSSVHNTSDISFSSKDENNLFLALISFDRHEAIAAFEKILADNAALPPRMQKRLYNYILNILLKVIHMKQIPLDSNKLDFEVLNDYLNQPPQDIKKAIYELINRISDFGAEKKANAIDYDEIIQYVSENYRMPELSLKYLSDRFFVNQNNLSTALKNKLGVGFHEYITRLRVEKAKELLTSTSKNINEIISLCGFTSAQTFYRVFKESTGMSAGEFRKSAKNG